MPGRSAEVPALAAAAIKTPQLITEGGDGGISFPFQALFLGVLAGVGATAAFLADAGFRLGAALHRRTLSCGLVRLAGQPDPARSRIPRRRQGRR
jgi:hypothetical protein